MLRSTSALRLALALSALASPSFAATGNIGAGGEDLITLDHSTVKVGIDRAKWTGFEPDMPDVVVVRCEFTEFPADTEAVVPIRNPNYSPAPSTDGAAKNKKQAKKA